MNDMAWLTFWMLISGVVIVFGSVTVIVKEKSNNYAVLDNLIKILNLIEFMEQIITVVSIPTVLAYITDPVLQNSGVALVIFLVYLSVTVFSLWQLIKAHRIEERNLEVLSSSDMDTKIKTTTGGEIKQVKEIEKIIVYNDLTEDILKIKFKANFKVKKIFFDKDFLIYKSSTFSKIENNTFILDADKLYEELNYNKNKNLSILIRNFEADKGQKKKWITLKRVTLNSKTKASEENNKQVWRIIGE